jgi:hypothetical protein
MPAGTGRNRMTNVDTFHSIAGIAVAFAGFTGIVLAVRRAVDARAAAVERSRLLDLLLASLGAIFFAYLPEVVAAFGVDEAIGWRACALSFVAYHTAEVVVAAKIGGHLVLTRSDWILVPTGGLVMVAQWSTGFGFFGHYVQAVYFVALLWLLFVAAYQFAHLLMAYDRAAGRGA